MRFETTSLTDALIIHPVLHQDERGSFSRVFCAETFRAHGLRDVFPQTNHSTNLTRGTLRGMHFQNAPNGEVKLVRAVHGAIFDVIIDLRPDSPSLGKWQGFELSDTNRHILYVPEGFAHGFQTLTDGAEVTYQVSHPYVPGAEGGVRWDDPAFAIDWPLPVSVISAKDREWPFWQG